MLARWGDGRCGDNVRVVVSRFCGIDGRVDGADFAQTHLGNRIEQAGIHLQPFRVNHLGAARHLHGRSHRPNLAVADDQGSVFNRRAREREDLCVCDRVN